MRSVELLFFFELKYGAVPILQVRRAFTKTDLGSIPLHSPKSMSGP